MIRSIIIDDEHAAVENLELLIEEYCSDIEIVGSATSIQKAAEVINKLKPELVFLDISMPPGGTGFELLQMLPQRAFQVIFITAYAEHTMSALKEHAFDYLLKPIDYKELIKTIQDYKNQYLIQETATNDTVILHTENYIHVVKNIEIEFCVARGSYTEFVLDGGKRITISKTLKHVESILNKSLFQRVHRSFIVNISKISKISKSDGSFLIIGNEEIPLSKAHSSELFQKLST